MSLRVISYGGGVQSTALLVLAAQGVIDYQHALFSNVGDDSEHPATLDYVRNIAIPWAKEHGIEVHELRKTKRDGTQPTLYQQLVDTRTRSIGIPVRMPNGAPGSRRCTSDYKITVVDKWMKQHGASKTDPGHVAIGISTDEMQRMNNRPVDPWKIIDYPLIDLRLDRARCKRVIESAGLPIPHKSSCYFCPYHRPQVWAEMRRDEPELFFKAAELEKIITKRAVEIAGHPVYLTSKNKPLEEAINEAQVPLFGEDGPEECDSGYCWT
jgi:PP-loop superfamily ATP-utilizing enzyme